jgi:hypothetical protein
LIFVILLALWLEVIAAIIGIVSLLVLLADPIPRDFFHFGAVAAIQGITILFE